MGPGSLLTNQFNGIPRQFWTLHFCCIWRVHCTFAIRLTVSRRASRGSRASWASRAALGALGFGYSLKFFCQRWFLSKMGQDVFLIYCVWNPTEMIAVFQKRSAKIACAKRKTTKNGPEQTPPIFFGVAYALVEYLPKVWVKKRSHKNPSQVTANDRVWKKPFVPKGSSSDQLAVCFFSEGVPGHLAIFSRVLSETVFVPYVLRGPVVEKNSAQ